MAGKEDNFFVLPVRPELSGERLELDSEHKKEAKKETTNLVGRLHAKLGDIIVVTSPGLEIGGFVAKYDRDMIELSHENPHSHNYKSGLAYRTNNNDGVGNAGNRQYRLSKFDDFSILKKASSDVEVEPGISLPPLVGRLFAQVGDIILLNSNSLSLAGYLLECNNNTVTLSHENPLSLYAQSSRRSGYRSSGITRGLRTYYLNYSQSFEVLRKAGENSPEEK